jgi:hypothetical protein
MHGLVVRVGRFIICFVIIISLVVPGSPPEFILVKRVRG